MTAFAAAAHGDGALCSTGDSGLTLPPGFCASIFADDIGHARHLVVAPNGVVFYDQQQFPAHYRHGVFIAFHGSWDRAPYPQQGYNVVFQPLAGEAASGSCEIFADGFAGGQKSPGAALHRPTGVAIGPDGALYVSDDVRGRIYRIVYQGGARLEGSAASYTPCPSAAAPAGAASTNLAPALTGHQVSALSAYDWGMSHADP
jgi:hypothetical protein